MSRADPIFGTESVIPAGPESFLPSTINFSYDKDALLVSSQSSGGNPGSDNFIIDRDSGNGFVTGTTLGDVTDAWTFDGFGETATYRASYNGSPLMSIQYVHDKLGRIAQKTESVNGVTDTYTYLHIYI
jgi:hypothetical protein